jgi:hypothetical protein
MKRFACWAILSLWLPASASALEIKNIRATHGPLGHARADFKCIPGDTIFMMYDIVDLKADQAGKYNYDIVLELFDEKNMSLFNKKTPVQVMPHLGGNSIPSDLQLNLSPKQAAGKYKIQLSVTDKNGKDTKSFTRDITVVTPTFGFVGVATQTIGFPGVNHSTSFGLVNLGLDGKKQPDVEITITINDDKNQAVSTPVKVLLPRDMPAGVDLDTLNFVPIVYPIIPNRSGKFTMNVVAEDRNRKTRASMSFPITVLDVAAFSGSK